MYSSYSYGGSSYGGSSYGSSRSCSSYGPAQTSRYRDMVSNMYGGLPTPNSGYSTKYTSQYSPSSSSSSSYSVYSSRGTTLPPTRGASIPPPLLDRSARTRTVFRSFEGEENSTSNRHLRLKSPSIPRERTRDELIDSIVHTRTREHRAMPGFKSATDFDELIDSIVHTRTREHRAMPGFKSATDFDERRSLRVDCDKVFNGIIIGNGETICNITYLKNIGVTHVLNTATEHVVVNPAKYPAYDIKYHGFHVDDLPEANISRYFHTTTKFIDQAVSSGGLVVVNCVMGWSRSATCVAAYLMMKHRMSATKALELIRQNRSIRPNAGFLQQLADLENTLSKRVVW